MIEESSNTFYRNAKEMHTKFSNFYYISKVDISVQDSIEKQKGKT